MNMIFSSKLFGRQKAFPYSPPHVIVHRRVNNAMLEWKKTRRTVC